MTKELKRFEQWWDAGDDIPNDGPYTPDTSIQFAWAGWQAALAQPEQEPVAWMNRHGACTTALFRDVEAGAKEEYTVPLYTTPPQRTEPVALPHEMTPEMLRQVQTQSELGAYAAANFSGAYDLFNEFWRVAIAAHGIKEQK